MNLGYFLPGAETVTLTGQTIDKLLSCGDGDAALLYLYILKTQGRSTLEQAAYALNKSEQVISAGMKRLADIGLLNIEVKSSQAPISISAKEPNIEEAPAPIKKFEDMKNELNSGSSFKVLVDECQLSLGKILSPDDLLRLFGIYDNLSMEPAVILHLITHCINESSIKGHGRKPNIRYIEKAAYQWAGDGITTLDKAEMYLKDLTKRREKRNEMKPVLEITDREFSAAEASFIDKWVEQGFSPSCVGIAYDRTILKTGKLAWKYMDTILNSWAGKGLFTTKDILEKDALNDKANGNVHQSTNHREDKSPMSEKFGNADHKEVERLKRLLNKTKGD